MNHFLRGGSISPKWGSASPKYPFYDSERNFAEIFLPAVEIIASSDGGGLTEAINTALDYSIMFPVDMYLGAFDFYRNYSDMRQANWKKSDKYFHAKANFQASQRGPGGKFFAEHFSNLREIWDQRVKGYPLLDSQLDQKANIFGREQSRFFAPNEFREALQIYRPTLLPIKY